MEELKIYAFICANIAALLYAAMFIFSLIVFGQFSSFSELFYIIQEKFGKEKGHYFVVLIFLICIFSILPFYLVTFDTWMVHLVLPSVLGLSFVGICPAFNIDKYKGWHFAGAISCAILTSVCILFFDQNMAITFISIASINLICNFATPTKDPVVWIENTCFVPFFVFLLYGLTI